YSRHFIKAAEIPYFSALSSSIAKSSRNARSGSSSTAAIGTNREPPTFFDGTAPEAIQRRAVLTVFPVNRASSAALRNWRSSLILRSREDGLVGRLREDWLWPTPRARPGVRADAPARSALQSSAFRMNGFGRTV